MPTFSQTAPLPSANTRQASPDYLGIRRVASRKRKTMNNSGSNSYGFSYDPETSPQSAFSSEPESCADRLHFAHAAEQLVAAASLVASLSFSASSSPNSSNHDISNADTGSISPSTSSPSSPPDSGNRERCSTPGSLKGLTIEERRQRRLVRNREAAKECRKKKKQYVSELEEKVQKLEDENDHLQRELQELQAKLTLSTMHTGNEAVHNA